ncbi:MAG: threonine--tRNA ligase [Deltaproteobacteria bacterium]|jgi:threonyl-tRNA synthetase|nr:threonine--tRNA ligase [Deltaproteobacteria bacterium]MBW2534820.1 threonine--tRNA ligase [Deltaproteobacteria bacterium]
MPIIAKQTEPTERDDRLYRIRHSTAHLMAEAVQKLWPGTKLAFGPPVQDGFYYDFDTEHRFTDDELKKIEKTMRKLTNGKAPFVKKSISKADAMELFESQGERLKAEHVDTLTDGEITLYESGKFVDLCAGPHVEHTGELKHFKLLTVSGSYWRGDEHRDRLQRIYGTAWETKEELDEHLKRLEEAKKRDHRVLGKQLRLFDFPEQAGPGLPFYLPKGALVLQELKSWMWDLHVGGGYGHRDKCYEPLATPHILKTDAWHTSGHIDNYRENMFMVYSLDELDQGLLGSQEGESKPAGEGLGNYGLKPMNCPGHVMLYNVGLKSYRDLPIRYFEFGTVYRYERAGTLHGMLRVRSFTQDDAHIFCTPEQYAAEVEGTFDFCCHILDTFGFDYYVGLKTRGEKRIGSDEIWDMAEDGLRRVLEKRAAGKYYVEEGDATFYGPKIDFNIQDSMGRTWQGGTIQLDFNLPDRFELEYTDADNERQRPVMIHRAILGSFERFFGLLIEEFGGAFPLWLAPVHIRVLPITEAHRDYAAAVAGELRGQGLRVELDESNEKLGKKIRTGKTEKIPYLVVVGGQEMEQGTITVESYFDGKLADLSTTTSLAERLREEILAKTARRKS